METAGAVPTHIIEHGLAGREKLEKRFVEQGRALYTENAIQHHM